MMRLSLVVSIAASDTVRG